MPHAADPHDCPLHHVPALRRRAFLVRAAGALAAAGLAALPLREVAALAPPRASSARSTKRYAIPATDGVQVDKDNEVILVRWQGRVFAFALSCPHQNTALRWADGDRRFQCPKHKSKYQPDGTFISGRATRNMDRLAISRDGQAVVVDLERAYESDLDEAGWSAAFVRV